MAKKGENVTSAQLDNDKRASLSPHNAMAQRKRKRQAAVAADGGAAATTGVADGGAPPAAAAPATAAPAAPAAEGATRSDVRAGGDAEGAHLLGKNCEEVEWRGEHHATGDAYPFSKKTSSRSRRDTKKHVVV